jgi:hypothetical protein
VQAPEVSHHSFDRIPESVVDAAIFWAVRLNYNTSTIAQQQAFESGCRLILYTVLPGGVCTL